MLVGAYCTLNSGGDKASLGGTVRSTQLYLLHIVQLNSHVGKVARCIRWSNSGVPSRVIGKKGKRGSYHLP